MGGKGEGERVVTGGNDTMKYCLPGKIPPEYVCDLSENQPYLPHPLGPFWTQMLHFTVPGKGKTHNQMSIWTTWSSQPSGRDEISVRTCVCVCVCLCCLRSSHSDLVRAEVQGKLSTLCSLSLSLPSRLSSPLLSSFSKPSNTCQKCWRDPPWVWCLNIVTSSVFSCPRLIPRQLCRNRGRERNHQEGHILLLTPLPPQHLHPHPRWQQDRSQLRGG